MSPCWKPGPPALSRKRFQDVYVAVRIATSRRGSWRRQAAEDFGEFLAPNGAWQIEGEPYISAPGSNFQWFRSRIVGGRTNHWGRIALRFAPVDFKSKTRDGIGDDWPISYEDLAPYYDKVECYIGVFGTKENIPSAPDGVFLPAAETALQ